MTANSDDLPNSFNPHLDNIEAHLGPEARKDVEETIKAVFTHLGKTVAGNPYAASIPFVARPTGYVEEDHRRADQLRHEVTQPGLANGG